MNPRTKLQWPLQLLAVLIFLARTGVGYSQQQAVGSAAASGVVSPPGAAGSAAASFNADQFTGNFKYSVPIEVAPGRQGIQPNLALGYNSTGVNGWCGVGWGISVPYIQRNVTGGTPVAWGASSPLTQYDDSKGFISCQDGARAILVCVSGTNQNPVVYRQQADAGFLTYNYYTNNYWTVIDKSGRTFYYGEGITNQMENSRTNWPAGAGGSTFKWALDRVSDANGNEFFYSYLTDGGQLYLTNISYNANANTPALAANCEVDFVLTNRPDTNITFISNYRVTQKLILSQIVVKSGGANVRKYVLGYNNSTSTLRSLLTSITQYGADFSTALPAITFQYQQQNFGFTDPVAFTNVNNQNQSDGGRNSTIRNTLGAFFANMIDMDGDGLPDRVMYNVSGAHDSFVVQRNIGNGFAACVTNVWGQIQAADDNWQNPTVISSADNAIVMDLRDMNGDGYPDLVERKRGSPYIYLTVQTNTGFAEASGFATTNYWAITNTENTGFDYMSLDYKGVVNMMDINGDGLPDRVSRNYNPPYNSFEVQLNTGNGFENPVVWGKLDSQGQTSDVWNSPSYSDGSGNQYVMMADINGDGLPDRVMEIFGGPYTNYIIQFNNGAGFEPAEVWGPLTSGSGFGTALKETCPLGYGTDGIINTLVDVNGDGLLDRVGRSVQSPFTSLVVQLNNGAGFGPVMNYGLLVSEGGYDGDIYDQNPTEKSTYNDFFDINGDGLPDRVYNTHDGNWMVQYNKGPFPDLLTTVSNGIGQTISVSYVASTTLDNRDRDWVNDPWAEGARSLLPMNIWVVSQIAVFDGMGTTSTNTYAFKGGFYYAPTKELRGFSQCTRTDPLGTKTTTYYHQSGGRDNSALGEYLDQTSHSKMGIPFRIDVIGNDGATNAITLNKVEEVMLNTNGWYFPFISQTTVLNFEGLSNYRATAQQFGYDTNTENMLMVASLGEVTNVVFNGQTFTDIGGDSVFNWMTYTNMGNILSCPSDIEITSDSGRATRLRESRMAYDGHGRLLMSESWLDSAGEYITNSSNVYDQYGNLTQTTDAAGIVTTTTYDSSYEQFPVSQATGTFTSTSIFDSRSGSVLSSTDIKGLVTSNTFDVFFRPIASYISTNSYGAPALWQSKTTYFLGGVGSGISSNLVYSQVNNAVDEVNGYQTYIYSDGSGRTIEARSEAENGQFRVANTVYDRRGNAYFNTLPYFSSGSSYTVLSGSELGMLTEYDDIGRSFRTTPAVNGTFSAGQLVSTNATGGDTGSPVGPTTTSFADGSNPWATVVTDARGKVEKTFRDAYGRTILNVDVTTNGNCSTLYGYDVFDDLMSVTDNVGNVTSFSYDSIGRKTAMQDGDMGIWSYAYDVAGRLTQQVDARTNTIKLYYADALGRLTLKQVYNYANQLVSTNGYIYDSSDDPDYTVFPGQIYKVTDSQGYQRSSYDVRDRLVKSGRFLKVNSMEYVTQSTYDDADRVQQLTYPGSAAILQYSYDLAGHLTQVRSLAGTGTQEIFYACGNYNSLDQISGYTNGNGVITAYAYFSNSLRLQNLIASKGGTNLQNLSYNYDNASEVTGISDSVYSGSASAAVSSIAYDDLYRVTAVNSTARGSKVYAYNLIGNVLTNGDAGTGIYQYGARPHAVTSANGVNYGYDAAGNMVSRGNQTLAYDSENHLVNVATTNDSVSFGYDANGQRLWRSGTNGYSIWIGGLYEINNGKVLCHVMAGGQMVATFEPLCGGLWSKAVGEKRWFVASTAMQSFLRWPFEHGRGHWTLLGGTWAGIIGLCLVAGRGIRLKKYEVRRSLRFGLLWKQAVTLLLISAFLSSSIGNADAAPAYNPVFYYYHADQLGSSNILTDRSGVLVQHYEYGTFGQTSYQNNTSAFPVSNRYTGQVADDETGLYYYGGRYYDPQLGRFIQPDPTVPDPDDSQSFNRYSYCRNNPLNETDPSGFDDFGADGGGGFGSGGLLAAGTGGDGSDIDHLMSVAPPTLRDPSQVSGASPDYENETKIESISESGSSLNATLSTHRVLKVPVTEEAPVTTAASSAVEPSPVAAPAPESQHSNPWLRGISAALDVVSLVPGPIGSIANVAQAGLELAQGHYAAAGMAIAVAGATLVGVGVGIKIIQGIREIRAAQKAEVLTVDAVKGEEAAALKPYGEGGGHHIPAKSAFAGDPVYDAEAALAIPNSELALQGISHSTVTGAQQTLYRAFARTGQPLTWDAMRSIETQALVKGGMSPGAASATVSKAINGLKASGVSGPTRIPWGGN